MDTLLTTREVCQILRISRPRLWYYLRNGQFPEPVRIVPGARPRWRKSDIDALIAAASNNKNASAANAGAVQNV